MMNKKEQEYNRRLAFKANSTAKSRRDKKNISWEYLEMDW